MLHISAPALILLLQHIMTEPDEITTMSGQKLPLKMSVDYISFSAHTDYQQTSEFIRALKPPHVVITHTPADQAQIHPIKAAVHAESATLKLNKVTLMQNARPGLVYLCSTCPALSPFSMLFLKDYIILVTLVCEVFFSISDRRLKLTSRTEVSA